MSKINQLTLEDISKICGSPKRLNLLDLLSKDDANYTIIVSKIKMGQSEVYKHLKMLMDYKLVIKRPLTSMYQITDRGKKFVRRIRGI